MMTLTHRRRVFAIFLVLMMAVVLLAGQLSKKHTAEGAYVCHTSVRPPKAPSIVWPMVSQFPRTRATAMTASWIDPLHRPGGGVQVVGTFQVNITMEYHWCIQGRHPKTTGLVKPYRTQICAMYTGFVPTGVRSIHWHTQNVWFPSLTSGPRQFASTASVYDLPLGKSGKGHWLCQQRAATGPWVPITKHPQWRGWGYVDKAKAKDWKFSMTTGGSVWKPYTPGTDQHNILF
jgi:hypothetical protein